MDSLKLDYVTLKSVILSKDLLWQHTEFAEKYVIFSVDGPLSYIAEVYKSGFAPIGASDAEYITDFETYFKPMSNKSLNRESRPLVQISKQSYGQRDWTFSHNFCDKTTWFGDSIRVVGEAVGTGNDVLGVFNLDHDYVIDLSHGKISDEDNVVPTASQGGTNFIPSVYLDGVLKTERPYGAASGGDYTINYVTGVLTFFTPPGLGAAITADYFYSPADSGSTMYIRPSPGKKTIITAAECQFSANLDLNDTLISSIFTYNPFLGAPPAKFEYPGASAKFKRFWDFVSYTNGTFPSLPAMGGSTRGTQQAIYQLRFEYVVTIPLDDAYGVEMRVWLENHNPYGGDQGQITFYGYQL